MSLLCAGSVAIDSIQTPFGERDQILGGSATHFSIAASFFTDVQLVAVVGRDFPEEHLDLLRSREIDLSGLEVADGETFRWKGRYGFDLSMAETIDLQLNVFANFVPKIPKQWQQPDILFLANIHPDLQRQVLESVERPRLVALDSMDYWIEGERKSLKQTIALVDLVVINEAECRQLAEESNLLKAARTIMSWGPKTVAVKQGEYGALLFQGDHVFSAPGFPLEQVMDPTGAGDSFAGGMIGYLARIETPTFEDMKQAVVVGSVMASFNVEDFGCDRMRRLKAAELTKRYEAFRRLGQFEAAPIAF